MKRKKARINSFRLRSSYVTAIISISLVLLLLGLVGLLMLNAKKISDHVKENIGFSVILKEQVKEVDIIRLQKNLDASSYVKTTEYISAEEAAAELQKELGEDFLEFLGYNPLLPSIEVKLHAAYANPDSINMIQNELAVKEQVKELYYQESLIHLINENVRKISLILLGFSLLMFLIVAALINNTIRLSVYSKRFIIKTMQLVGATKAFIRRPFLLRSALHGVYGALIAIGLLTGGIYYIQQEFREVLNFQDVEILVILFGSIIIAGILISWISTFFAVNRYLRLQKDELYE